MNIEHTGEEFAKELKELCRKHSVYLLKSEFYLCCDGKDQTSDHRYFEYQSAYHRSREDDLATLYVKGHATV